MHPQGSYQYNSIEAEGLQAVASTEAGSPLLGIKRTAIKWMSIEWLTLSPQKGVELFIVPRSKDPFSVLQKYGKTSVIQKYRVL